VAPEDSSVTACERKGCMIGAAGVGKTSLVRRFVEGVFSDRYLSTIGVKIDRKSVKVGMDEVHMVLWDIEGETDLRSIRFRYLRGAAGYLVVADGTRPQTLDVARQLQHSVADRMPGLPFVLLLNKLDRADQWALAPSDVAALAAEGWTIVRTSAANGLGVEDAFRQLAVRLLPEPV
jgi:small GTP-binding protein